MTPKEKAKELVERFDQLDTPNFKDKWYQHDTKQCALICVERERKAKIQVLVNISEYLPTDIYAQAEIFANKEAREVEQEILNF